jgi:glycosyltransferase involved in cell wall biosynthesis
MNIGFEAKRFFTNKTGLGNYNRFIVDALSVFQPQHTYRLYTPRTSSNPEALEIGKNKNIEVVTPSNFFKLTKITSIWRSWAVTLDASMKDLNIFHGLSQELPAGLPSHIKKIVTVHDLIFYRYPEFYNPIDVRIYKYKLSESCKRADLIIAISEQTANDLVDFLKIDREKIKVVYQGCHPNFRREITSQEVEGVRLKYNLPEKFLLNVGTIEVRKNLLVLVRALASLPKHVQLPLVVVGKPTAYLNTVLAEAKKLGVFDKMILLHHASFTDFPAIYRAASIFIYPSLFEGFGIPLVEAMECGVPVITSKGSCFSEAAGPSSLYVNPQDADDLASQIFNILTDQHLCERMVSESFAFVTRFRPHVIAGELDKLYQNL